MARWSFVIPTWTPVAVADTVAMTSNGYQVLTGGSTTQRIEIGEVYLGGLAGASTPSLMLLARDSTLATTPTALAAPNGLTPFDPNSAALAAPMVGQVAASTGPQRSSTAKLLAFAFNAFGGIVRLAMPDGYLPVILGSTAPLGEMSLSAYTGGTPGLMTTHMLFEPM